MFLLLAVAAYGAGLLTILSPCVWPVLPFVLGRTGRPFRASTLPLLVGMASAFAAAASLAAVAGDRIAALDTVARVAALVVLGASAVALLVPDFASWASRPALALGQRLLGPAQSPPHGRKHSWVGAVGIGAALGLLWTPCAGPVLGLVLSGAAIQGPGAQTWALLAIYAAGAATPMAALLLGSSSLARMFDGPARIASASRRGMGALALIATVVIAGGWDKTTLARWTTFDTSVLEQGVLKAIGLSDARAQPGPAHALPYLLRGASQWLNGPPPQARDLQGKVVLVHFWTYSCINCLRALPHLQSWAQNYGPAGLVVIGVHTPEFAFEKRAANVSRALQDLGVKHAVAMDNDFTVWRTFQNNAWPALYLFDASGKLRLHHPGEGRYAETESQIRDLLRDAGARAAVPEGALAKAQGVMAPASGLPWTSPETYLGHARASGYASGALQKDRAASFAVPANLRKDHWALGGNWAVRADHAESVAAGARIAYRFTGRDLHLVLGTADGKPVRFRVLVDGRAPSGDRGTDTDAQGHGVVDAQRLYQLVRRSDSAGERVFEIEFLDPGAQAYAFTFG